MPWLMLLAWSGRYTPVRLAGTAFAAVASLLEGLRDAAPWAIAVLAPVAVRLAWIRGHDATAARDWIEGRSRSPCQISSRPRTRRGAGGRRGPWTQADPATIRSPGAVRHEDFPNRRLGRRDDISRHDASRLPGKAADGDHNHHFHPVEARQLHVSFRHSF